MDIYGLLSNPVFTAFVIVLVIVIIISILSATFFKKEVRHFIEELKKVKIKKGNLSVDLETHAQKDTSSGIQDHPTTTTAETEKMDYPKALVMDRVKMKRTDIRTSGSASFSDVDTEDTKLDTTGQPRQS